MSRALSPRRPGLRRRLFDPDSVALWGGQLLRAASGRPWWIAATGVLVVGGAVAGLHPPTSGAWFWHLANGELIRHHGLGGTTQYLARPGAALDLRSWLSDVGLLFIYRGGGLGRLEVVGALGGAVVGLFLLLAIRYGGRAHPLAVVVAGGIGTAALAPVLTDLPSEVLALLAAALLLALAAVGRHGWWGVGALVALVVVWTNTQADAFLVVLVIWGWLVFAHGDAARSGRAPAPTWWLVPLTGLAVLLSPKGIGTLGDLPLSLGMGGEHPLVAAWSSIDFHPWSARIAELAGVLLLFSYWVAGSRLRRADAYLGLVTAVLALLWANYLPWFLVVAAVQSSWYLSAAWLPQKTGSEHPARRLSGRTSPSQLVSAAAAIPLLVSLGLLTSGVAAVGRGGGATGQTTAQLPVQAAGWLAAHPARGAWFTTPLFGDYLSARFPTGRHLLCVDDPLPLAGPPLGQCHELTVLNAGAMAMLRSLRARLAVLPRAAPAAVFLLAQGWEIRYRDSTTVILAPRNL